MGFYARHIFSRVMDRSLGTADQLELRREALAGARGDVLEIGFGTGLNLACYPEAVRALTAIDTEAMLERRVESRVAAAPFPVERRRLDAGGWLPFETARFDTVVSTWTLCSIEELGSALDEIRRVLSPGGAFLFMEHGRSDHPQVARLQDFLNPIQNVVACGCNLNRPIDESLRRAGLEIVRLERFKLPGVPRPLGEVYRGTARIPEAR